MKRLLLRVGWHDSDGIARLAVLCTGCATEVKAHRKCHIRSFGEGSGECEFCQYEIHREVVE